jgi:hypothetical protein
MGSPSAPGFQVALHECMAKIAYLNSMPFPPDALHFLQVQEARMSVMEPQAGKSTFTKVGAGPRSCPVRPAGADQRLDLASPIIPEIQDSDPRLCPGKKIQIIPRVVQ